MSRTIVSILGLAIVAFCVFIAAKPSEYRIERSKTIQASPEAIFKMVNDHREFNKWSPWAKLDPNARAEFSDPSDGAGATFTWAGNKDVGKGKMTIIESAPYKQVRMKLDFEEPMVDTATVDFLISPEDNGAKVTWAIFGNDSFVAKIFLTFMDREKMVGDMYEKGLNNLKTMLEESSSEAS